MTGTGWSLDHVLLAAHDLDRSVDFYERLLEAQATQFDIAPHPGSTAKTTAFAHLGGDDGTSIHLARPTPNFHALYPDAELNSSSPHVAITVDDLAAVEEHLAAEQWSFMPPKSWGPAGYLRLYSEDPSAQLVEVNQLAGDVPARPPGPWRLAGVGVAAWDVHRTLAWFAAILGASATAGTFVDCAGRDLAIRAPDTRRWLDPARHARLAVPDVPAAVARVERVAAVQPHPDGTVFVADPSLNVLHVVAIELES